MPTFKKKDKALSVHVSTVDADLEFEIQARSTGKDLFDTVCKIIGIRETWYFGLRYIDRQSCLSWLEFDKKISDHDIPKDSCSQNYYPLHLDFLVRFFPESMGELIQEITTHLFFLQIKQAILNGEIYSPPNIAIVLASYALQAKYGDYKETFYQCNMIVITAELPYKMVEQYEMMNIKQWQSGIQMWHQRHLGLTREEVECQYLRVVQELEMCSVQYFNIFNKKKTELWLGVTPFGLNIYEKHNKLEPKVSFLWNEIRTVCVDDKKFSIKLLDKEASHFIFFSNQTHTMKLILDLCIGNHDLFLRRRREDSLEVQQMKAQAREDLLRREAEKDVLIREKKRREDVEKENLRLQEQLEQFVQENEKINEALKRSEQNSTLMAQKSKLAQEEAYLLAMKANQAELRLELFNSTNVFHPPVNYPSSVTPQPLEIVSGVASTHSAHNNSVTNLISFIPSSSSPPSSVYNLSLKEDPPSTNHLPPKDNRLGDSKVFASYNSHYFSIPSCMNTHAPPLLHGYNTILPNIPSGDNQQFIAPPPLDPHKGHIFASDLSLPIARSTVVSPQLGQPQQGVTLDEEIKVLTQELEKENHEYEKKCSSLKERMNELHSELQILKIAEKQADIDKLKQAFDWPRKHRIKARHFASNSATSPETRAELFKAL